MSCYHPVLAFRKAVPTKDGKRPLLFNPSPGYDAVGIPCGQCIGCRQERQRQWAIRIMCELQTNNNIGCFVTLTYDDQHLEGVHVYGGPDGNIPTGNLSLNKVHLQKFIKRLRKELAKNGTKIKHFSAGEYGENYARPHFHLAIIGWRPEGKDLICQRSNGKFPLFESATIAKCWRCGFHTVGDLSFESAAYVASYINKKLTGKRGKESYGDRAPEFALMSRGGRGGHGLGYDWFQEYKDDVFNYDKQFIRGYRWVKPAKYFDRLYGLIDPDRMEELKKKREELMSGLQVDYLRLAYREEARRLKQRKKNRGYENADS